MGMSDPGYDETDMTPEEFEAIMAEGTPADISPSPVPVLVCGLTPAFTTGSCGTTQREHAQLAGDRTIRESRVLAGT